MKYKHMAVIFVFMIVLSIMLSKNNQLGYDAADTATENNEWRIDSSVKQSTSDEIINVNYKKNGIAAEYPILIQGGSEEERKKWNQIIEEDFNKILEIYSFNPFPELTPVPADQIPVILRITYVMKLNDSEYVSILYTAAFNSPYSAHPSELVYSTNISKAVSKRIRLSDIVKLDQKFVENFRTWDFVSAEEGNEELNKAIKDYVTSLSDEDLLMGFKAADIIGSGNLWGVYSYLASDRLGISLGVPHYIGDHVEFENEYEKLQKYLKPEFKK